LIMKSLTTSNGSLPMMGNIPPCRLTKCNLKPRLYSTTLNASVWKVWPLPSVNFWRGWLCKVGFGQQIDFKEGGWPNRFFFYKVWPNSGNCPLCSHVQEAAHILHKHRFSTTISKEVLSWCGI
jgi:hypothetical protein